MSAPLLAVDGLGTYFFTKAGVVKAVDGVSFTVARGEVVGLVGESGSGKSMTGYSIMGLIDPPGRIVAGTIALNGRDLSVVAGFADRVCVMYAGKIVEQGTTFDVLTRPWHPYTQGLLDSVPSRGARGTRLAQIPGMTPSVLDPPPGCAFRERCAHAGRECLLAPEMRDPGVEGRGVRCFHPLVAESVT
jgi:oligopeptide/dipeptide ABC transporter ATP-binding protein